MTEQQPDVSTKSTWTAEQQAALDLLALAMRLRDTAISKLLESLPDTPEGRAQGIGILLKAGFSREQLASKADCRERDIKARHVTEAQWRDIVRGVKNGIEARKRKPSTMAATLRGMEGTQNTMAHSLMRGVAQMEVPTRDAIYTALRLAVAVGVAPEEIAHQHGHANGCTVKAWLASKNNLPAEKSSLMHIRADLMAVLRRRHGDG